MELEVSVGIISLMVLGAKPGSLQGQQVLLTMELPLWLQATVDLMCSSGFDKLLLFQKCLLVVDKTKHSPYVTWTAAEEMDNLVRAHLSSPPPRVYREQQPLLGYPCS